MLGVCYIIMWKILLLPRLIVISLTQIQGQVISLQQGYGYSQGDREILGSIIYSLVVS